MYNFLRQYFHTHSYTRDLIKVAFTSIEFCSWKSARVFLPGRQQAIIERSLRNNSFCHALENNATSYTRVGVRLEKLLEVDKAEKWHYILLGQKKSHIFHDSLWLHTQNLPCFSPLAFRAFFPYMYYSPSKTWTLIEAGPVLEGLH